MMTRKDYVSVSEGLRTIRNTIQDAKKAPKPMDVLTGIAEMLADMMEEDNDRFDRKLFMANSGLSMYPRHQTQKFSSSCDCVKLTSSTHSCERYTSSSTTAMLLHPTS